MAKITILPSNIALLRPPLERLEPLHRYRSFLIEEGGPEGGLLDEEKAVAQEMSLCSALPAGLVPRIQEDLTAAGYHVVIRDRRCIADGISIAKELRNIDHPGQRSLVRAVLSHPQGQIEWDRIPDMAWRMVCLTRLWPEARVLIVADPPCSAQYLGVEDLAPVLGEEVGLLADVQWNTNARCLITTQTWLARLRLSNWQVLLLQVQNPKALSQTTYEAVVHGRVPRVYALVARGTHLGPRIQLRLEAMAGPVIDTLEQP